MVASMTVAAGPDWHGVVLGYLVQRCCWLSLACGVTQSSALGPVARLSCATTASSAARTVVATARASGGVASSA